MRFPLLPLILIALLLGACAEGSSDPARELEGAQELLSAKKYDEAYAEYLRFAEERGNHLAEFTLGMFHRVGWDRPKDQEIAFRWFEKAAEGDIPVALHYVAEYLLEGAVAETDPAKAAEYLRRSAALGHFLSNLTLGEMYLAGEGVPVDVERGLKLIGDAAQRGAVDAQFRLGMIKLEGELTRQDYAEAARWLEPVGASGNAVACFHMGRMARDGLGRMPSAQTAIYWFEMAAQRGYAQAYLPVAELYVGHDGDKPHDDELAKAYLWVTAAEREPVDTTARARATALRGEILKVMPPAWQAELDQKVDAHLEQVHGGK